MRQLTCRNGTAELYITTNERLSEPTVRGGPAPIRETFSDSGATISRDTFALKSRHFPPNSGNGVTKRRDHHLRDNQRRSRSIAGATRRRTARLGPSRTVTAPSIALRSLPAPVGPCTKLQVNDASRYGRRSRAMPRLLVGAAGVLVLKATGPTPGVVHRGWSPLSRGVRL